MTFRQFLKNQTHRNDLVGDFARTALKNNDVTEGFPWWTWLTKKEHENPKGWKQAWKQFHCETGNHFFCRGKTSGVCEEGK